MVPGWELGSPPDSSPIDQWWPRAGLRWFAFPPAGRCVPVSHSFRSSNHDAPLAYGGTQPLNPGPCQFTLAIYLLTSSGPRRLMNRRHSKYTSRGGLIRQPDDTLFSSSLHDPRFKGSLPERT
jgi:hypothetical protein